ncbi:serine/threonine protein kinase [Candidatus Termititenax aidoneus]|uniref:Serine/threonine protein kinase n=1 Tax=Termititenax aidoneus TaxID=2218524 RepID=A0A388TC40_TERA1|nr:serine/threonine protein kinase [Candidatus Termititenax aidoneus]
MAELLLKNRYSLGEPLKTDAAGVWHKGLALATGQTISIRAYRSEFCQPALLEKLQDSILETASLRHPNITRVIDSVSLPDGRFFVIYDTPYEKSLADILAKIKRLPLPETLNIITAAGKALEHAQDQGIVHGALCPDNIDILNNGEIKVRNFYIDGLLNSLLTVQNKPAILDAAYLAPEQLRGESLGKSTDVLGLGLLFYRLLAGRTAYPEINNKQMMLKNYLRPPEKLTIILPDFPQYLEDIIFKALQHRAAYRQQSAAEFLGDLQAQKVTMPVAELIQREQADGNPENQPIETLSVNVPEYANIDGLDDIIPQHRAKRTTMPTEEIPNNTPAPKKNPPLPFDRIIYYALLGIFAAGLALFINSIFFNYFNSVPRISIPDVLNIPAEEASILLRAQGLRVKFGGYINSDITPNHVVAIDPVVGRIVKKNRIVRIYTSQQTTGLTAPNLIEHTLQSAVPLMADRGLTINVAERVYSNKYPANQIISQAPEAGAAIERGEKINVTISDGYPVWLEIKEKTVEKISLVLHLQNEPEWEQQNAVVYLQTRNRRRKFAEKLLHPGEKTNLEITAELGSIIEVYYFNDLAYRLELQDDLDQ